MEYTPEILQKVKTFGALGLSAKRIALLIGFSKTDEQTFIADFNDEKSLVFQIYEQGVSIGEYNQDAILMKQAEKGDLFAIQELKIRQFNRDLEEDRKERFGI